MAQQGRSLHHGDNRVTGFEEERLIDHDLDPDLDGDAEVDEENDEEEEEDEEPVQPPITTRQYLILSVLMIATLTSSFAVCLFPPFFPKIAEEKGCNAAVYGFIIGTNCLTSFIVTPFIGKKVSWKERRLIDV